MLGTALGTGIGGVIIATGQRQDWSLQPTLLAIFAMSLAMSIVGVVLSSRLPRTIDGPAAVAPSTV